MKRYKQDHIADEIAKDVNYYLSLPVKQVKLEIGEKLHDLFEENKWSNDDSVVYSSLLSMARAFKRLDNG